MRFSTCFTCGFVCLATKRHKNVTTHVKQHKTPKQKDLGLLEAECNTQKRKTTNTLVQDSFKMQPTAKEFLDRYTCPDLSIYLPTYLFIYLSISIFIYLFLYLYLYLSIYASTYLYITVSLYPSFSLSLSLSLYLSIYLSMYLSICLSVCLSIPPIFGFHSSASKSTKRFVFLGLVFLADSYVLLLIWLQSPDFFFSWVFLLTVSDFLKHSEF